MMQPSSQTKLIPIKVNHELNFVSSAIRYHTIGLLHSGQKVVFEDDKRHDFFPGTLFCFNLLLSNACIDIPGKVVI